VCGRKLATHLFDAVFDVVEQLLCGVQRFWRMIENGDKYISNSDPKKFILAIIRRVFPYRCLKSVPNVNSHAASSPSISITPIS
jgi:hypothetical protein